MSGSIRSGAGSAPDELVVIRAETPASAREVRELLRTLADAGEQTRDADGVRRGRTWAWLGELEVPDGLSENERVVEHDRVGRLAVRLAVDKTLCIGDSRSVRALHQGAVMEGSWGDEVRIVDTATAARDLVREQPDWRPTAPDVILVAAATSEIAALLDELATDLALPVRDRAPADGAPPDGPPPNETQDAT
ncbi:UDP-N-acetylmuramoyl-tripeptide--D-alanyl-D-alanine ligase [Gordonia sp. NPDC003422]